MPHKKQNISITDKLKNTNIDTLNTQEAPKLLLRSMKYLGLNSICFTYETLINFMINNYDNYDYYKGKNGIKSNKNLYNYWCYAGRYNHSAKIDNFDLYYILV